jgi:hypothetical protein
VNISVEQYVALLGAVTALVVAVGAILVQLRQLHTLTNSRMSELLELTRKASEAEGFLAGTRHETTRPLASGGPLPPPDAHSA